MMKSAIAVRHVGFEDTGSLAPRLEEAGYLLEYREAPDGLLDPAELEDCDLLILLGGPIGVYEADLYPFLHIEIAAAHARLQAGRPVLGICLGAQMMAAALGSRVYPGTKELGWSALTLTDAGRRSPLAPLAGQPVLHWHGDTFDLPAEATLLASTPATPHQAFAVGRHGLALQFHVEADERPLERWYVGHAGEIAATPGIDVPTLRAQAAQYAPGLAAAASRLAQDWLAALPGT